MNNEPMWNTSAESLALAGLLHHPENYWEINDVGLEVGDFGSRQHKQVFEAIDSVVYDKNTPELPLVIEALRSKGYGNGVDFVNRLFEQPCSLAQAKDNVRIVKGLSIARGIEKIGVKAIEVAREYRSDYETAFGEIEAELASVRRTLPTSSSSPNIADILSDLKRSDTTAGIPIRFSRSLQHITGGLIPGWLWVVGGFSSVGKSAVAVNFITDVLHVPHKWVGVISTEMPKESYAIRLLSAMSGVPQRNIRERVALGSDQVSAINDAERQLSAAGLRIYDSVYSLKGIRAAATRMKKMDGLDVLIVDFVQNIYITGDEVADARTAIIGLQELAKELGITIIVFSQISNDQAIRMSESPNSDYYAFKGSGAIKDAADVAILLSRAQQDMSPFLKAKIVKNRQEQIGTLSWKLDLPTGRITELNSEV